MSFRDCGNRRKENATQAAVIQRFFSIFANWNMIARETVIN